MGRGVSKVGGGGGSAKAKTPKTQSVAEDLQVGDVISPGSENWTIHMPNGDKVSGNVNNYITVDAIKIGAKTVSVTGHYDLSGNFPVGSDAHNAAKNKLIKVTKSAKKGTVFKLK